VAADVPIAFERLLSWMTHPNDIPSEVTDFREEQFEQGCIGILPIRLLGKN
jgi:hypothetical protein